MEADVILTHTAPEEIIRLLGYVPDGHDTELTGFLEWILREVKFKRWFFGHWHVDQEMHSGCRSLYYDLVKLNISEATEIKEEFIDYELF